MVQQIVRHEQGAALKRRSQIFLIGMVVVALGYAAVRSFLPKPQYDSPVHSIMIADCGTTTTADDSEPKWSDNIQATFSRDSTKADLDRALGRRVRINGTLDVTGKSETPIIKGENFFVEVSELRERDGITKDQLRAIIGKPTVVEGCLCKVYFSAAPIWLVPNPRPDPRANYLMALPTGNTWLLRNVVWKVVDDNEAE